MLPHTLEEIEYRLPARYAIRLRAVSGRIRMGAIHVRYQVRSAHLFLQRSAWWITVITLVLAYLAIAAWMDNDDLRSAEVLRDKAIARLSQENTELRHALAEQVGTRNHKLLYLIEAGSTTEAKDKLSRLAMMFAAERFALDEATEKK
jgi:hypothetical protein